MERHNYTSNMIDTITAAIKAGTNLELGSRAFDNIVSRSYPSCTHMYVPVPAYSNSQYVRCSRMTSVDRRDIRLLTPGIIRLR